MKKIDKIIELEQQLDEITDAEYSARKNGKDLLEYFPLTMKAEVIRGQLAVLQLNFDDCRLGCKCQPQDRHGETSVMCCNNCGKPTEEFWVNENVVGYDPETFEPVFDTPHSKGKYKGEGRRISSNLSKILSVINGRNNRDK